MGRKRTVEDYQRTAEENDWVPDPYEEENSIQQTKDDLDGRYNQNQQEALDEGIMRLLDSSYGLYLRASAIFFYWSTNRIYVVLSR
jgi:hypothetical protein